MNDPEVDGLIGWHLPPSNVDEPSVALVRAVIIVTVPIKVGTMSCRPRSELDNSLRVRLINRRWTWWMDSEFDGVKSGLGDE